MVKPVIAITLAGTVLLGQNAFAEEQVKWGYHGDKSFEDWGKLDAAYSTCTEGTEQSPINISEYMTAELATLKPNYQPGDATVVHNGHTIQVDFPDGQTLQAGDTEYHLKQLHFHTPSEHYLDGSPYPMEVHFVHQTEAGDLGVVGVMMEVGERHEVIDTIWKAIPEANTQGNTITLSAVDLLPEDVDYFTYEGSLTTPPCTEGVKWHVVKEPIEISREQLITFQTLFPVNARPIQPLNDRTVKGGS